jgi:hypothetical protein
MRAKFRLSDIKDLEGLIYKLSEVGVSLGDIYRQLAEGKEKNIEFYVEKDKVQAVSSAIKEFCQFEVVYEGQENKWIPFLLLGIWGLGAAAPVASTALSTAAISPLHSSWISPSRYIRQPFSATTSLMPRYLAMVRAKSSPFAVARTTRRPASRALLSARSASADSSYVLRLRVKVPSRSTTKTLQFTNRQKNHV